MKGKKLITLCKNLQFNIQTTLQLDKNELLKSSYTTNARSKVIKCENGTIRE